MCYITFKTRFTFKEPMKSNTRLLAPGPTGAKKGFAGQLLVVLDRSSVGDKDIFASKYIDLRFDSC